MKKVISIVIYFSSILLALIIISSLVNLYIHGIQPITPLCWLLVPMIVLSIIWTENFAIDVKDQDKAVIMDMIIGITYLTAIGTFISISCFQTVREMKPPIIGLQSDAPWLIVVMFIYVIVVGPIRQFKRYHSC